MSPAFFHLDRAGALTQLQAGRLSDQDVQGLIAEHPALLDGAAKGMGRWFVLRRSADPALPGCEDWSSRHLFLNRDGVPTIVEARRTADVFSDSDLFGRALFYAANARVWWPPEALRAVFAAAHAKPNLSESVALHDFVGDADRPDTLWAGSDAFWRRVTDNLAAGRLRMVIVVEQVQPELARLAEFLRHQLRDAEVWILECRHYGGPAGRILQTRLVGSRAAAAPHVVAGAPRVTPPTPARPAVNSPDAWLAALRGRCEADEAEALDDLLRWMREQYGATFVTGPPTPAYWLSVKEAGRDRFPFGIDESKSAAIHLGSLSATVAYRSDEHRRGLVQELVAAGLADRDVDLMGDLRIPLQALVTPTARSRLLRLLDGVLENLRLREATSVFAN